MEVPHYWSISVEFSVEQSHDLNVGYLMIVSYRRTAGRSNCSDRGMSSVKLSQSGRVAQWVEAATGARASDKASSSPTASVGIEAGRCR